MKFIITVSPVEAKIIAKAKVAISTFKRLKEHWLARFLAGWAMGVIWLGSFMLIVVLVINQFINDPMFLAVWLPLIVSALVLTIFYLVTKEIHIAFKDLFQTPMGKILTKFPNKLIEIAETQMKKSSQTKK
jgi:hypothetical protein